MFKRIISMILAMFMFFSVSPMKAAAEEGDEEDDGIYGTYQELNYVIRDGEVTIRSYDGSDTEITIPDTIEGYPVVCIGDNAFWECWTLKQITLPDSLKSIGRGAFYACSELTEIRIPENVISIGSMAFRDCDSLKTVNIPDSVTEISGRLFEDCRSLENITLPSAVTAIGSYSFYGCWKLRIINIPDTVTAIEVDAFANCHILRTVLYGGTEDTWNSIRIESGNDALYKAYKVTEFVLRLYRLCFGREADTGGLNNWTGKLKDGSSSAANVIKAFFMSREMNNLNLSDEEYVERCYRVMMNRSSDAGGKRNWLEKLDAGVSYSYVLKGFAGSKEFAVICSDYGITAGTIKLTEARDQNIGITQFVSRCYREVLGRKADTGGLNTWCQKILSAADKKQAAVHTAASGFFRSREYLNKNVSDEEYVRTLYRTFLGREADEGGYHYWLKKIQSGTSRDSVLTGFANSKEFAGIMAQYGIK